MCLKSKVSSSSLERLKQEQSSELSHQWFTTLPQESFQIPTLTPLWKWKECKIFLISVNFRETSYSCSCVQQMWKACLETWMWILTPCPFSDVFPFTLCHPSFTRLSHFPSVLLPLHARLSDLNQWQFPVCQDMFGRLMQSVLLKKTPDLKDFIQKPPKMVHDIALLVLFIIFSSNCWFRQ